MTLLTWDDEYTVHNEELDKHHKVLFELLNKLYMSCFDENGGSKLDQIYEELVSYTSYHFSAEEQYMRNIGYDNADNHIKSHSIFTDRISQLHKKISSNNVVMTKELIVYLGNWLLNHVLVEDRKYSVMPDK
jgi:hemerythrin